MSFREFIGTTRRSYYYLKDHRNNQLCSRMASGFRLPGGYKRIYHYHIRKTAGTSLNHMFFALDSEKNDQVYKKLIHSNQHRHIGPHHVFVGWNKKLIEEGDYFYGFSHIPIHRVRIPDNSFTITILRDPIQRLVSHYKMLLEESQKKRPSAWFKAEQRFLGKGIEDFSKKLPRQHLLNQLHMFSDRFDISEAADAINKCDSWFFTDNFENGIKKVNLKLQLELTPIHIRSSKTKLQLSEDQLSLLHNLLQPEYDLFTILKGT